VSTTNNNQAMNESIRRVANQYLDGNRLNEALLNQVEVAIRAYDPCLSCATHAIGKMPMELNLVDDNGELIDRLEKRVTGQLNHCEPPPAYLLTIRAYEFGLGQQMSKQARANLQQAYAHIIEHGSEVCKYHTQ